MPTLQKPKYKKKYAFVNGVAIKLFKHVMASVTLKKQQSVDEILQNLERGFPAFVFTKISPFKIQCTTSKNVKYNIKISGNKIEIYRYFSTLMIILSLTIVLFIAIGIAIETDPTLKSLKTYLSQEHEKIEPIIINSIFIPDTCPQCKNPNTKKLNICEWCDNKIIY